MRLLAVLALLASVATAAAQAPAERPAPGQRTPNPVTKQTVPDPSVVGSEPDRNTGANGAARGPTIPNTGTPRIMREESIGRRR